MAQTPPKSLRIPQDLWDAAVEKARREGRTLTEVVIDRLRRYVASPDRPKD